MSLDVSEPDIAASYSDLLRPDGPIDWFILGHGGTSTKLFLLDSGNGGLEELRARLVATEVLYGLLRVQDRILLWSQIPDGVGGVKRARALVHARSVSNVLRRHDAQLSFAAPPDLEASAVALKLFHQTSHQSSPVHHSLSTHLRQRSPTTSSTRRSSIPDTVPAAQQPQANGVPVPASEVRSAPSSHDKSHSLPSNAPHRGAASLTAPPGAASAPRRPLEQAFTSGYPSHLAVLASRLSSTDPSNSPTNGTAPHAFPASSVPATTSSAPHLMPHSPSHPEDEWRRQTHSRPSSPLAHADSGAVSPGLFESAAAAMLVSSPSDPSVSRLALPVQEVPVDVADEDGSVARAVPAPLSDSGAAQQPDPTPAPAHAPETAAVIDEVEQKTRAFELEKREDAARLEREKREHEAEEAAARVRKEEERRRADAEAEYRRQAEEQLEREQAAEEARRKAIEEEARLRAEEEERQRAAEEEELARIEEEARLAETERVLEQQRIEEERRRAEEAEKARLEEEERTRKAEEEMRLLIERQRAEKQLREEEEARKMEEARRKAVADRKSRLVQARDAGEVMLSGTVNVQGGGSMLWRRRYFRLRQTGLELYKSEADTHTIVDSVAIANIDRITSNPEEALVPHSFKLTLKDDDEWLFYYNTAEETEALVEALQCAMRR